MTNTTQPEVTPTQEDYIAAEEIGGPMASYYEYNRRSDYEEAAIAAAKFRVSHSTPASDRNAVLEEALKSAAESLSWAARRMKGSCRGSDIDAVNLAAGLALEALRTEPAAQVEGEV